MSCSSRELGHPSMNQLVGKRTSMIQWLSEHHNLCPPHLERPVIGIDGGLLCQGAITKTGYSQMTRAHKLPMAPHVVFQIDAALLLMFVGFVIQIDMYSWCSLAFSIISCADILGKLSFLANPERCQAVRIMYM